MLKQNVRWLQNLSKIDSPKGHYKQHYISTVCLQITIKEILNLPSVRLLRLRDITSQLNIGESSLSYQYLSNKIKYLKKIWTACISTSWWDTYQTADVIL